MSGSKAIKELGDGATNAMQAYLKLLEQQKTAELSKEQLELQKELLQTLKDQGEDIKGLREELGELRTNGEAAGIDMEKIDALGEGLNEGLSEGLGDAAADLGDAVGGIGM